MSLKKLKKENKNWGIEDSYFPIKISIATLSESDLEHSRHLTPSERLEWLMMMQDLLITQFENYGFKKNNK